MKWHLFVLLGVLPGIGLFSWSSSYGEPLKDAHFPSLVSSLKITGPLEFCDERVPIEIQEIRERLEKELLLSLWDRPQVILWLKRSRRYLLPIEQMLRESGMPDDLKYLAIAESALRPHAGSKKGAIGFWQFTEFTGRKHGLLINERIDERRNIFASTQAAIRCFKHLRNTFGSWTLAAAAYNMGEEGLMAEILEQGNNNYYH
ncbi:MAG: lytic transglycosylase domain-containing protein, partial [Thermodesulfobacteriota bacterium]